MSFSCAQNGICLLTFKQTFVYPRVATHQGGYQMLVIKNLTLTLSKDLRVLIEDFSFSLQNDMKVALIGEEGNGKSTLLKAICEPEVIQGYMEMEGEIITSGEV